jgi:hypothetical protein
MAPCGAKEQALSGVLGLAEAIFLYFPVCITKVTKMESV